MFRQIERLLSYCNFSIVLFNFFVYWCTTMAWQPVQLGLHLSPEDTCVRLQHSCDPEYKEVSIDNA